ncbi:MAG: IS1595 family transposase [Candidatus Binatus sp.]|jgi:transposase-like protein
MINDMKEPRTLKDAVVYFSDPDNCLNYLVKRRWPNGVHCPSCGSERVSFVPKRRVWQCKTRHPKCQFSVKVGTIFEDSPLGLDKWLPAVWMITNCKNGVSSWEIHRAIGVTQKTAWFMLHRIRLAMHSEDGKLSGGEIEADETFIGGLARNMHKDKKAKITGTGGAGKAIVMGLLDRNSSKVRLAHVPNTQGDTLHTHVRKYVKGGSYLFTDAFAGYHGLDREYIHQVIDHAESYVEGNVHTNSIENFWSLLKRGLKGTYVSVEPFHLFRYLDEQAFRYNNRKEMDDGDRFNAVVSQITDKRLTYDHLTGKDASTTPL